MSRLICSVLISSLPICIAGCASEVSERDPNTHLDELYKTNPDTIHDCVNRGVKLGTQEMLDCLTSSTVR